jgi:hypothetical protein
MKKAPNSYINLTVKLARKSVVNIKSVESSQNFRSLSTIFGVETLFKPSLSSSASSFATFSCLGCGGLSAARHGENLLCFFLDCPAYRSPCTLLLLCAEVTHPAQAYQHHEAFRAIGALRRKSKAPTLGGIIHVKPLFNALFPIHIPVDETAC